MKSFRISLLVLLAVSLAACGGNSVTGPDVGVVTAEEATASYGSGAVGAGG